MKKHAGIDNKPKPDDWDDESNGQIRKLVRVNFES